MYPLILMQGHKRNGIIVAEERRRCADMTDAQNQAIAALYERWAKTMVYLTVRRLHDVELAKDLVQEVFVIAYCKAEDMFSRGDNPKAWLFRTLENVTMQHIRKSSFGREIPVENMMEFPTVEESSMVGLHAVFPKELSKEERAILLWRIEEGLTYEEISKRCNATPEACRKRFSRAIQHCRVLLEKNRLC